MIIFESILDLTTPTEVKKSDIWSSNDDDIFYHCYKYLMLIDSYKDEDVSVLENVIDYLFDSYGVEHLIGYCTGSIVKGFLEKHLAVRPELDRTYMCICFDEYPERIESFIINLSVKIKTTLYSSDVNMFVLNNQYRLMDGGYSSVFIINAFIRQTRDDCGLDRAASELSGLVGEVYNVKDRYSIEYKRMVNHCRAVLERYRLKYSMNKR